MSIEALNQVYDEMRRLAIAGSNLAGGDFRLKKLIPPLEKAGAKAPVFAKVAEAVQKVVDSTAQNSSAALLDLSTLVTAVLYTQGQTGAEGKISEIKTANFDLPTSEASARVLKPLIEALTTTGSGRMEIIRDAQQRGAFQDLRLVKLAVAAIDDVYGEIGDFIADQVLPIYGKAIYADLRDTIDVKGKAGHVRRLRTMHRLDPEATHDVVEQALESGSKEMKIAALECLRGSKEHLSYLLGQTKASVKDVRRAALEGIAEFSDKEVVETLQKAIAGSEFDLAVGPASRNRSEQLLSFLLDEGQRQFDELFSTTAKAKLKAQLNRFQTFLTCFATRTDKKSDAFLTGCFQRRDELQKLKGDVSGEDVVDRIATLFVRNNSKAGQELLVDARESCGPDLLHLSMLAALRTKQPKEVFDLYAPYFLAKPGKKKGRDPVRDKREVVQRVIHTIKQRPSGRSYLYYGGYYDDDSPHEDWFQDVKLDPRWLDAAVETEELETVMVLARPNHPGTIELLAKTVDGLLKKKGSDVDYETSTLLDAMNRINHPQVVDFYLAALEKAGKGKTQRYYYAYWLLRLIPDLPKQAAPKIEALVPSLNEKLIDEIVPYLEQLKAK